MQQTTYSLLYPMMYKGECFNFVGIQSKAELLYIVVWSADNTDTTLFIRIQLLFGYAVSILSAERIPLLFVARDSEALRAVGKYPCRKSGGNLRLVAKSHNQDPERRKIAPCESTFPRLSGFNSRMSLNPRGVRLGTDERNTAIDILTRSAYSESLIRIDDDVPLRWRCSLAQRVV